MIKVKWVLLILAIVSLVVGGACDGEGPHISVDRQKIVDYSIVNMVEERTDEARILKYQVVIEEPAGADELKETAKKIVDEAIDEEDDFNCLSIFLYDREELTIGGHTLGRVDYTLDGNPAKAEDIEAGDYNNMEFGWRVMEKDWGQQPSARDVEIYAEWYELYREIEEALEEGEEVAEHLVIEDHSGKRVRQQGVDQEIADKFGVSEDRINDIFMDITEWKQLDLSR